VNLLSFQIRILFGREDRFRLVLGFLMLSISLLQAAEADQPSGLCTHSFDRDPAWDSYRNRLVPEPRPRVRQDFGWQTSNHAGGEKGGDYDLTGAQGRGQITVRFDDHIQVLDLNGGAKSIGATFDRFGLFNMQQGGWHVITWWDDLTYTARSVGRSAR
jgi:hypothetical protein